MATLTTIERDLLRSKGQRYRLYLALWHTWQVNQTTVLLSDASEDPPTLVPLGLWDDGDFPPIINIGTHRLGFAGEALEFDASRSWVRGDNPGESVLSFDWNFSGATTTTASGEGPHSITWNNPGLYTVTCESGGATATRWVRILADRLSAEWNILNVDSVGGNVGGGWKANLRVVPSDDNPSDVIVEDFQSVGIFCEEEWQEDDGTWTTQNISGYPSDPMLVMSGYVLQGSISNTANSHEVSFSVGSLADQLNLGFIYGTATWRNSYVTAEQALGNLPDPVQGILLDVDTMTMVDVMHYWLSEHTNILQYHDFISWYDGTLQALDEITSSEGSLWSALQSWTENEFAFLFTDQGNGLHFEPNPHLRSASQFQTNYPVRMLFTDRDIIQVDITDNKQRNVIWVQLEGIRIRDNKVFLSRYPDETPPAGAGTWLLKKGYNVSRQSFVDAVAPRLYADANRNYPQINLNLAMNRACVHLGRIEVTLEIPDEGISWDEKVFIVQGISYNIDLTKNSWFTSLSVGEVV